MPRMSKVLLTIPPALLERIDREAGLRGLSRSAFLREAARRELASGPEAAEGSLKRLEHIQDEIERWEREQGIEPFESATAIREDRDRGHSV